MAVTAVTPVHATTLPVNVSSTGLFQLDGNTMDPDVPTPAIVLPGDDWNDLSVSPVNGGGLHNNAKSAFVTDLKGRNAKVFSSGSKDTDDISLWHWSYGSSPNKADIQNAYAAAYIDSVSGHLIVYFGADRAATSGTVSTGFWFFKNPVKTNADGTFSGHHALGDTLVTVDYSGGVVSTIAVYVWGPSGLVQQGGNIANTNGVAGLFCNSNNSSICAITNGGQITTPWTGSTTRLKAGQFFEGGIDLSALVPGTTCFSSVMAMSRSSTSTTSSTKNFLFGNFPVCNYNVTKTVCSDPQQVTGGIQYTVSGTITNTGFGPVSNISLSDSGTTSANTTLTGSGSFNFTGCNTSIPTDAGKCSLASNETAQYSGPMVFSSQVTSDTIHASGTFPDVTDVGAGDRDSNSLTCPPLPTGFLQVLSDTATTYCSVVEEVQGSNVVLKVNVSAKVANTGTGAVTGVSVTDSHGTTFTPVSTDLAKQNDPNDSATFTGSYYPTAIDSTSANTDCVQFSDVITAHGSGVQDSAGATVSCGVCPSGECPQSTSQNPYVCKPL